MPFFVDLELDCAFRSVHIERAKIDIRQHFGAALPRRLFELARDRAHSSDRHLPFARLIADEVIKKTAVLNERGIVRMRKDADLRVGQHKAAHQIVLQITFDRAPERFFR